MAGSIVYISVAEFCRQENLSQHRLLELVEYEIAQPVAGTSLQDWEFDATGAHWMKTAIRLQRDFDLEWLAVAMLVDLLRERENLHSENQRLRRQLDRLLAEEQE